MEYTTLTAAPREQGKRAARSIRREKQVPCVLYGHDLDTVPFKIDAVSLTNLIRSQETPLVKIELGGKSWNCILKDVAYHPVTDEPMHADFQVLHEGEKIAIAVPFRFKGTPVGQMQGGSTQHVLSEVEILSLPKNIPPYLEVDITNLKIGGSIHVSDLEFGDLEFVASPNQTVVMIHAPRILKTAAEEEEEEGEEGDELVEDEDAPAEE